MPTHHSQSFCCPAVRKDNVYTVLCATKLAVRYVMLVLELLCCAVTSGGTASVCSRLCPG